MYPARIKEIHLEVIEFFDAEMLCRWNVRLERLPQIRVRRSIMHTLYILKFLSVTKDQAGREVKTNREEVNTTMTKA